MTSAEGRRSPRRPVPLPDLLVAPLSGRQIDLLNRYQRGPTPCLCPFRDQHRPVLAAETALVAVTSGMVCPGCDYRQDWAHPVANPRPGVSLRTASPVPPAQPVRTLVIEAMPRPVCDIEVTRIRPPYQDPVKEPA